MNTEENMAPTKKYSNISILCHDNKNGDKMPENDFKIVIIKSYGYSDLTSTGMDSCAL